MINISFKYGMLYVMQPIEACLFFPFVLGAFCHLFNKRMLDWKPCAEKVWLTSQANSFQFIVSNRDSFPGVGWRWNPTRFSNTARLPINSSARVVVGTSCLTFVQSCSVVRNSIIRSKTVSLHPAFWIQPNMKQVYKRCKGARVYCVSTHKHKNYKFA